MSSVDNRYSRFVLYAKVAFPLIALGLLSTLFLLSSSFDSNQAIPFADIDVEKITREQSLTAPRFSGVTSDGSAVSLTAKSATPDPTNPRRLMISPISARVVTKVGANYRLLAESAIYDGEADTLDLVGNVTISTSAGYQVTTKELMTSLETTSMIAPGRVTGTGPDGTIEAGRMELLSSDDTQILVFKDGVKLIYQRQR